MLNDTHCASLLHSLAHAMIEISAMCLRIWVEQQEPLPPLIVITVECAGLEMMNTKHSNHFIQYMFLCMQFIIFSWQQLRLRFSRCRHRWFVSLYSVTLRAASCAWLQKIDCFLWRVDERPVCFAHLFYGMISARLSKSSSTYTDIRDIFVSINCIT